MSKSICHVFQIIEAQLQCNIGAHVQHNITKTVVTGKAPWSPQTVSCSKVKHTTPRPT